MFHPGDTATFTITNDGAGPAAVTDQLPTADLLTWSLTLS
jgi:hypothetical protein